MPTSSPRGLLAGKARVAKGPSGQMSMEQIGALPEGLREELPGVAQPTGHLYIIEVANPRGKGKNNFW